MLLTACWNALNSCPFNYANVHMQMTMLHNTMLSQLGDRLVLEPGPDYNTTTERNLTCDYRHQTSAGAGWHADRAEEFACVALDGPTCGILRTCIFTCYVYWFGVKKQWLKSAFFAAIPTIINRLLQVQLLRGSRYLIVKGQILYESAIVMCQFLYSSLWAVFGSSGAVLGNVNLKLSNNWNSTCNKILLPSL